MNGRAAPTKDDRPVFQRGDHVVVSEPGLPEWEGTVLSVKPGEQVWYVEVRQADGMTFAVPAALVRRTR